MLKKIKEIIKKIVFNILILYGYNLLAGPLNIIVPINIYTVGALTVFSFPALLSFIVIHILVF